MQGKSLMCDSIMGIDPGLKGGIAYISKESCWVSDMPKTVLEVAYYLHSDIKADCVVVEKVHALPGQSCKSNFTFGMSYQTAIVLAITLSSKSETELVTPQEWKKYFGLKREEGETKAQFKKRSVDLARELFPDLSKDLPYSKDGRAEALLIAEYYRRTRV